MEKENKNLNEINITPKTSIFKTFKKYTYKNDSAIGEVLDNSIQSYINHKDELHERMDFSPSIEIIYYSMPGNERLMICDNSFGVEDENINRIFLLQELHKNTTGRNEFGMGLKTAGFWFGNKIEFISKQYDTSRTFKIVFDLDMLDSYGNTINIEDIDESEFKKKYSIHDHGSTVIFSNLNKKLRENSLKTLVTSLSIKFGNDIIENKFKIRIIHVDKSDHLFDMNTHIKCGKQIEQIEDAKPLTFEPQKFRRDSKGKELSKIVDVKIPHDGIEYAVNGKIGILETGSRSHAGLILKRRGRTIIGDENDTAYRPRRIFKDPASFEWQRLYGVLNLDNFPANQSKSDFDWDEDLQNKFDDVMYHEFATPVNFMKTCKQLKYRPGKISDKKIFTSESADSLSNNLRNSNNEFKDISVSSVNNPIESKFIIKLTDEYGDKFTFNLFWKAVEGANIWLKIEIDRERDNEYNLTLDKNNPFFNPFSDASDFIIDQMATFAIYFAYSEIKHSETCKSSSDDIRNKINDAMSGNIERETNG